MSGEEPAPVRRLIHCSLPPELVHQPVLHGLVRSSEAVVNVHRANVDVEAGLAWFILELSGPLEEVERAQRWLTANGVTVEPIEQGGRGAGRARGSEGGDGGGGRGGG
jgi:NIL domain